MRRIFGTVVAIVKTHDIALGRHEAGVLLILPFKRSRGDGREEVALDQFLRPIFGIAQYPVERAFVKINIDDDILMSAGERKGAGALIYQTALLWNQSCAVWLPLPPVG